MACPPATARALKGLSRPSGRRCDRRSRGATTARDTDDASLHGEGQVREDSTPAGGEGQVREDSKPAGESVGRDSGWLALRGS